MARNIVQEQAEAMRYAARQRIVADLKDGRRTRSITVPAKRGAGSYQRRPKHRLAI